MNPMKSIVLPDYLVILAYFAVIVVVGLYFARYIRQSKDYFAAGNIMPWWLAGTSFYKASFSALALRHLQRNRLQIRHRGHRHHVDLSALHSAGRLFHRPSAGAGPG